MARYVVERDFGRIGEDEMQEMAARMDLVNVESFPDIVWERSHVCTEPDEAITSLCVYTAPSAERLREHADRVGGHVVTRIFEVVAELTPEGVEH